MLAVGADGYARGWVAVALRDGRFERLELSGRFIDVLDLFPGAAAFGVDIPIGVPHRFPRPADLEAGQFVKPLTSSVFMTPPRAVLEAGSHSEATARMHELVGQGISRQSHGLGKRILEVEPVALEDQRVFEVHPEVSFRELATAPLPSKHTWTGFHRRHALLEAARIRLPSDLGRAPLIDVLDAAIAAWSADRFARGEALPLPDGTTKRIGAIWR
jgi:predicted RNase H-like nuclease